MHHFDVSNVNYEELKLRALDGRHLMQLWCPHVGQACLYIALHAPAEKLVHEEDLGSL